MKRKKAFITGITGQDGSYLAEFLLDKNYEVHGMVRRSSSIERTRIDHLRNNKKLCLHYGDLTDSSVINQLIKNIKPDEIYNLGAQSHVKISFEMPEYTVNVTGLGTLRLLDAIRESKLKPKFYQASSSEMFGDVTETPQKETTPFNPRSPYGVAKVFAHNIAKNYREGYGMFVCSGILFNHESPRRGENFATRKITTGMAEILAGRRKKIRLGNLNAKRDWGYAPEYVEAMWLMMQRDRPDDYVISTGETHSVKEFVKEVFNYVGLDWRKYIEIDPRYFRPAEVNVLTGDSSKARKRLGWCSKTSFKDLVRIMVDADIKLISGR